MTYDTARSSRNADFISIAPKGETTHYILRVASAPSKCVRCAPQSGNPPPFEPFEPSEPSEPSHRRCVQRRQPRPFFIICGEAATTTLGAEGPSNLRTLRPIGPVHLKNLHARRAVHHPMNPMNPLNPAAHHFAPFPWRWYNIGVIVRKKRTCKFSHHLGWEFRFRKEE